MSGEYSLQEGGLGVPSADLRRCARCLVWKSTAEFHRSRTDEFTYCRDCRNAYDRLYYAERGGPARRARRRAWLDSQREWMNSLKADVSCADCGEIFPPFVMHWDHLPGFEKRGEIGTMLGHYSRDVILEELKKCELVCANCHVMRTVRRATAAGQDG
jgi:hypothetical protein